MAARRLLLLALVLATTLAGAAPAAVAADTEPPPPSAVEEDQPSLSVLVANVGNVSRHCRSAANKLCLVPVEQRVTASLAAIDPDVVALTEVLPPHWCDRVLTLSTFHTCNRSQDTPQVARLLAHDDYDIACTDRFEWNCLAVRSSVGSIAGCDGGYCGAILPTMPVIEGCARGFENVLVDVELHGAPLTIGVAHLNSSDVACRTQELTALFDAAPEGGELLLAGDFNLDPWRMEDTSVDVWNDHVGDDRRFTYRSGIAEHDPPHATVGPPDTGQMDPTGLFPAFGNRGQAIGRTLDHLVGTAGLPGTCTTLGAAPDTRRIDGSEGGLDHLALDCEVVLASVDDRERAPARIVAEDEEGAAAEPSEEPAEDVAITDEAAAPPPAPSPIAPVTDLIDEVVAEVGQAVEPLLEDVVDEVVAPLLEPLRESRPVAPRMQPIGAPVGSPLTVGLVGAASALLLLALAATLGALRPTTGARRR